MGTTSWRGQIYRALKAIDHIGESKYIAKQAQAWRPGEAVAGLYSYGTFNTVFKRAITYTTWLNEQYSTVRLFKDVDDEMTTEFLSEKLETCQPDTVQALLATLRKLQEGLYALNWIKSDIVPTGWRVTDNHQPRGPYAPDETKALLQRVGQLDPELGQALRFILSSGARIDEVLHLRADKVSIGEKRVELIVKGGKTRNIRVLDSTALTELDLSRPFVFLPEQQARQWKDRLERHVRQTCDGLGIQRRGVHGFRATAAFREHQACLGLFGRRVATRTGYVAWSQSASHGGNICLCAAIVVSPCALYQYIFASCTQNSQIKLLTFDTTLTVFQPVANAFGRTLISG